MRCYLMSAEGITVQRQRVRDSLHRVDPEGAKDRFAQTLKRRVYSVATPNSLWHGDAHLKLVR